MPHYYINREWVEVDDPKISLHDAGFVRGDGIFESLLVENGHVFRLEDHLRRLSDGLEKIRISPRENHGQLKALVREYIRRNSLNHAVIRVIVTRGIYPDMPWNYSGANSLYITHTRPPEIPKPPVKVVFLDESEYPVIRHHPAVKSLNYLGNILAKMDAHAAGAFEPVMYNSEGYITEGGVRNVFFVKGEILMTPPLSLGILPGTMRDAVIETAREESIEVREELIPKDEVWGMDEAFLTSTAVKILPMMWDGWSGSYQLTERLSQALTLRMKKARGEEI